MTHSTAMRSVIDAGRELGVHPRDLVRAVNGGAIDGWMIQGEVHVQIEAAAQLDLPIYEWQTLRAWARAASILYTVALGMLLRGKLDGVNGGKHRRWVLESVGST